MDKIMSTETATPPVAPAAAPAKPATPPIPAAQTASVKNVPPKPSNTRTPPEAPPSMDGELKKLAEEHFKPKGEAKPAESAPPVAEAKPKEPIAEPAKKDAPPPVAAEKEPLDIPEPKGMTPENLANWKAWREQAKKEINDAKNEKAALAAKLKTYETASPADNEKAARLEAQLKEVQDRLAIFDLKSTPDFQRQFVEPKQNALKEAAEIVAYNGREGVNLAAVLDKPLKEFNAEVSELTKDMNGMDATTVQTALRQAYKLANDEKGALSRAGEIKAGIEAKNAAAARAAFEETRSEFTTKVPELQVPEGASPEKAKEIQAYNAARAEALKEAEHYSFGKITEKQVAQISQQAAALKVVASHIIPSLTRERDEAVAMNRQLAAELAAIKKGKNPGAFVESGSPSKPDTSKMDVKQLAKHMLGGADPR
jgi:hypothetical protein